MKQRQVRKTPSSTTTRVQDDRTQPAIDAATVCASRGSGGFLNKAQARNTRGGAAPAAVVLRARPNGFAGTAATEEVLSLQSPDDNVSWPSY